MKIEFYLEYLFEIYSSMMASNKGRDRANDFKDLLEDAPEGSFVCHTLRHERLTFYQTSIQRQIMYRTISARAKIRTMPERVTMLRGSIMLMLRRASFEGRKRQRWGRSIVDRRSVGTQ